MDSSGFSAYGVPAAERAQFVEERGTVLRTSDWQRIEALLRKLVELGERGIRETEDDIHEVLHLCDDAREIVGATTGEARGRC